MRTLIMPASYPPVLGGLQTAAHTLARGLAIQGHTVQVVTNHYPRSLTSHEWLDGIEVRRLLFLAPRRDYLAGFRPDLLAASLLAYPLGCLRLAQLSARFHPQVLNLHFPDAGIPFALWLQRRFDLRLVVSLHGDEVMRHFQKSVPCHRSRLQRLREVLRAAAAVTAPSRFLLERAAQLAPGVRGKGCVIPNGIAPERFHNPVPYPHPRPYLLAFGRFTHTKGFDLLVEAFSRLGDRYSSDLDLLLAGDGEERDNLEAQARALRLGTRVRFLGAVAQEVVVQLLAGCRFVVVPSRQDSFGIAALEALAAGKPVLAARVGGLPETLPGDGTHSLLVEPTVEGHFQGLQHWLENPPPSFQGTSFQREIWSRYAWDRAVDSYERVLQGAP